MIKIIVADDHPLTRMGIRYSLLESISDIQVFEAGNGDELISLVKEQNISLVTMDLNMPDTDPQRVLQTLLALKPELSVLICSMDKEEIFGKRYLKMGAMGYLKKNAGTPEMIRAVRCVLDGNVYINKEMKSFYMGGNAAKDITDPFIILTQKEIEVMRHLVRGGSLLGIAQTMNIGSSTVGTHKNHILKKLQVTNMFELKHLADLYNI